MAKIDSITIPQGCDYELKLTILEEDGLPKDLSNYDVRFRVSNKELTSRYIDFTGSTNNVIGTEGGLAVVTDAVGGKLMIEVAPHTPEQLPTNNNDDEKSINQSNNIYSVVIIHSVSGKITKILQGDCYVEPEL